VVPKGGYGFHHELEIVGERKLSKSVFGRFCSLGRKRKRRREGWEEGRIRRLSEMHMLRKRDRKQKAGRWHAKENFKRCTRLFLLSFCLTRFRFFDSNSLTAVAFFSSFEV